MISQKLASLNTTLRVKITIQDLLIRVLSYPDNHAILTICDSNKGQDICRHRLFDLWFKQVSLHLPLKISKFDSDLAGEGLASIFIRENSRLFEEIKHVFLSLSSTEK